MRPRHNLAQVESSLGVRHYSRPTVKAHSRWMRRFILLASRLLVASMQKSRPCCFRDEAKRQEELHTLALYLLHLVEAKLSRMATGEGQRTATAQFCRHNASAMLRQRASILCIKIRRSPRNAGNKSHKNKMLTALYSSAPLRARSRPGAGRGLELTNACAAGSAAPYAASPTVSIIVASNVCLTT